MKYNQEIEREIEIEADELVELFRNQQVTDGGTRIFIGKMEFLRAMGKIDPGVPTDELREEHGTPREQIEITSISMEDEKDFEK